MFCSKCGANVADGTAFCSACGQPIVSVSAGQPAAGIPSAPAAPACQRCQATLLLRKPDGKLPPRVRPSPTPDFGCASSHGSSIASSCRSADALVSHSCPSVGTWACAESCGHHQPVSPEELFPLIASHGKSLLDRPRIVTGSITRCWKAPSWQGTLGKKRWGLRSPTWQAAGSVSAAPPAVFSRAGFPVYDPFNRLHHGGLHGKETSAA